MTPVTSMGEGEEVRTRRFRSRTPWIWLASAMGIALMVFVTWDLFTYGKYIDAFSGATPSALKYEPPGGIFLKVDGRVERPWRVNSRGLRLLASIRIRTREVSPEGDILGAYIHTGIPVMHILAGVDPKPPPGEPDDRPLDLMVVFKNGSGAVSIFTYGELVLADDTLPVTLAWKREPLNPERGAENYKGNLLKGELSGLRLICPGEKDTARYLDDVVKITLMAPVLPGHLLPPVRKHFSCTSQAIFCIQEEERRQGSMHGLPVRKRGGWFRIGHGLGIRANRLAKVRGVSLAGFLKMNFPRCVPDDFFLVSGCDGYRVMLSGREIFDTSRRERFLLMDAVDGMRLENGIMLGVFGDFFIDRCVRGVSHVVRLEANEIKEELKKNEVNVIN